MQYITNYKRTDGFGAQFQSVLWTLLFADFTNKKFVYTDITDIDLITTCGTIKDTENENSLEEVLDYMGFNKYCINRSLITENVNSIPFPEFREFIEKNIDTIHKSQSFQHYKEFFYKNKVDRFNKDYINVAVHIRKLGNFEKENGRFRHGTHDLSDLYYLDKINLIRQKYSNNNKKVLFHIYSQGDVNMFENFISHDTVLHLNEKVLETFTDLIFADVLVTCRSSFSYLAALFSNNKIYYLSFWHPPLDDWLEFTF